MRFFECPSRTCPRRTFKLKGVSESEYTSENNDKFNLKTTVSVFKVTENQKINSSKELPIQ